MDNLPAIKEEKSIFLDVQMFEHAQRVGKMLATSTMVPEHFRNNIGNCIIALNYAQRVGIDPFMAMQKLYIVHGKPGIEATLQIALFNNSGRFSALKFEITGDGDARQCVASAKEKATGEVVSGPPVSIKMAKDEGWYGKAGSKWKTMPDMMLRYRAAAFFIRLHAPETTLGLHTTEELYDSPPINVTPTSVETITNGIDPEKLKAELATNFNDNQIQNFQKASIESEQIMKKFADVWDRFPDEMYEAGRLNKIDPNNANEKQANLLITAVEQIVKRGGEA